MKIVSEIQSHVGGALRRYPSRKGNRKGLPSCYPSYEAFFLVALFILTTSLPHPTFGKVDQ
eukprot:Pgem_evm1s7758